MPDQHFSEFDILRIITQVETLLGTVSKTVEGLVRENEGTVDRKGMKERIVLAEANIEENKKAYAKLEAQIVEMEARINRTIQEAFIELKNELKGPQSFIRKYQPWVNIVVWAITLAVGWLLIQVLSGELVIVRP